MKNDIKITVLNGELPEPEINTYIGLLKDKYSDRELESVTFTVDGDSVDIKTEFKPEKPFIRIRRITGYLVGTLDRFCDGKRAEEHDRVKHSV